MLVQRRGIIISHIFPSSCLTLQCMAYMLLFLRGSWCLQPPVTAVAPCRPPPPLTVCSGEEDPVGATWPPYAHVSSWSTLSTLAPMPSGLRGKRTPAPSQTGEDEEGEKKCTALWPHSHSPNSPTISRSRVWVRFYCNQLKLFAWSFENPAGVSS